MSVGSSPSPSIKLSPCSISASTSAFQAEGMGSIPITGLKMFYSILK